MNSPVAYLNSLPDDLKSAIREAFFKINENAPDAFKKLTDGKARPWEPTTHDEYLPVVELIKFVDTLKKKKS